MSNEPESKTPTESNDPTQTETPRRSIISIPFLLVVIVLVAGGYPAGKWAMEKYILMQETNKATGDPIAPPEDLERTGIGAAGQLSRNMGGAGGRRGGGGDPEERFATLDADDNGKLEGDEISERMQTRIEDIDTDEDGAISKEEFLTAMENWRARQANDDGEEQTPNGDDSNQTDE